jgi:hypothetical protein
MQSHTNLQATGNPIGWALSWSHDEARRFGARIIRFIDACAHAYSAAALYEELSRLSNAELERRGIPRAELHRCVFEALTKR